MLEFIANTTLVLNHLPNSNLILLFLFIIFAYHRLSIMPYLAVLAVYLVQFNFGINFWKFYAITSLLLAIPLLRQHSFSRIIVFLIKKLGLLPKISETEKIALTSGTIWVDGELFSGKPDFKRIFAEKYPHLTSEEESFLKNEVEELCKICSDYEIQHHRDLPEKVWHYLSDHKFFGMIIPKEYGGLGFSAYAHSCVIQKLASRSVPLAITAMVPNSLGPAELLMHYGTQKQRDYYLPRLAVGKDLPCFALTEPMAGSDATSITSNGVLFEEDGVIKIRLNWNKRYITLGAYATVIGLAFQLRDPDKILFDKEDVGITCALISHKTKGVIQGRRHDPLATPFVNSPINGENVIITLDSVIGGQEGLGKGWKMLMECLAAGRGISLPSTSCGGAKLVARTVSAYCSIRHQFNTAIGKFEGVEEVLARIASRTYMLDALRSFTAGSVDSGAKPAVVTAIAKYHATETFRQVINDGMDIMGGRGIIRGPRNILANAYFSTPISITVEGANIMTRSLIHFGQGAIMCHPYVYKEIEALEKRNLKNFDRAFFAHISHLLRNLLRSMLFSVTRGHIYKPWKEDVITKYERKIMWSSATFALLADIAIAKFGGNLKRKETINGRFGDILSGMYILVCLLKKFQEDGMKKDEEMLVRHAADEILTKMQFAFDGLYKNLFGKVGQVFFFPFAKWARLNSLACVTSDKLGHQIVKNFIKNGEFRNSLTTGIFVSNDKTDNLGRLENAMKLHENNAPIIEKIKNAIRNKSLPQAKVEDLLELAFSKNIISLPEKYLMQDASKAIVDAMQVDEYSLDEYLKI